ncbi:PIG-P-domain-containing protein [Sporormia fimetaria CBS 119925]|uniref:PIG-P-domain-containing protein n=1 Tax=Sporormia fimetaria CBS 119925 TaxID=1340428 RepID=A0A6A6VKW4_9PLEO|nr:PIG-P-domain-containing protein [Sporormia fimetaria CBS 119925]
MPPKSRGGSLPTGFQSKSTPNLPTTSSLRASALDNERHAPLTESGAGLRRRAALASDSQSPAAHDSSSQSGRADVEDGHQSLEQVDNDPDSDASITSASSSETDQPSHLRASHTHLFPPFYNRPPAPLPPSPSLRALLRPPFATPSLTPAPTPSRPSSASSSDTEAPTHTPTPLTSAALATPTHPAPPATPKIPTYEYYGFALYVLSTFAFSLYVLWAYLPTPLLHQLGIYWYPDRWWAVAVPCWLVVLVLWIYVALASYNTGWLTMPLERLGCLVDDAGRVAIKGVAGGSGKRIGVEKGKDMGKIMELEEVWQFEVDEEVDWRALWSIGTDAVLDVPLGGVCEILYGRSGCAGGDETENGSAVH